MSRAHCRCTVVRNYDYAEAAEKLRCERRFLEDRITTLLHQKLGRSVAFCDCELALIQARFTVAPAPGVPDGESVSTAVALRSIRPSGRTRATASA
ncbi:hypothetical protein [Streptomyces sp. CA-253872]|uniref:hypothetical protein n=1 Tax=Streptomyces sp. CA-253872 TaxID=3240067 RepID=UPI003D91D899